MTPHQRFQSAMHFQPVDRPPLWEWNPWRTTVRRWQREGMPSGNLPHQYDECDEKTDCGVYLWTLPKFRTYVIEETDETITRMSERGVVLRTFKSEDIISMPEHIEYPVKNREDWRKLKERFDPSHPERFPGDWRDRITAWEKNGPVVLFQSGRAPSLFGFVRELMGAERTLYTFHDDPCLIHEMMEHNTEFLCAVLRKTLGEAPLSTVFFWEDMCYKNGPLISPAMFRKFMVPRYRRITDLARNLGVDVIFVDSDGNVEELIPLWLESGINGVYPMEVAAGMDVADLRKRYGMNLLMAGGIDKRALAGGRDAVDAELSRVVPAALEGGYIPHVDHALPHDIPFEAFTYYWERKKTLLGIR